MSKTIKNHELFANQKLKHVMVHCQIEGISQHECPLVI